MKNELHWTIPPALGLCTLVLVWAIGCAIARKKKGRRP